MIPFMTMYAYRDLPTSLPPQCLVFQPSIHGLYLAHVLMPGVYLAFTEPGNVIQDMVSNIFYLPAMYMRCMLANCHVPCTCPCMQLTFLLMIALESKK